MTAPPVESEITVNGDRFPLLDTFTIGDLLTRLKVRPERVVVELNGVIHRRGEGLGERLSEGDEVEIVQFVGGG
ncbi:MAG: sulfur carrier protein ThiS [Candidatus Dormibacteria bacterium]